LVGY
jgi:hypothetical protein